MSSSSDENTRLLRLHHNHLFFADGFSIELSATNIPQETLIDPSPENVFWKVRVLNYYAWLRNAGELVPLPFPVYHLTKPNIFIICLTIFIK
ncbi:MAG: hypothetical protein RIG77_16675 [Cyclobacteriaceae bacterium]